jgi:glycosyltransferase involved in cell wall biosynthesis
VGGHHGVVLDASKTVNLISHSFLPVLLVTVILCTHNPRPDYLAATLEGLRAQSLPSSQWEFLLIDNASSPEKAPAADFAWHSGAKLIREETLGLTPARLRGIREAKGDLLVFVDDDNILDPIYLETALQIASEKAFLGSWSGQCRGRFDEPPPEWTRRYWGNLAIREFKEDRWSNMPRLPDTMPCGAGLCVRRAVALHYLELNESGKRSFQFDRTGDSMVSGGDNDLAACACDLGLGVGILTSLKLQHLMPPGRLTVDYLSRLTQGIHFSSALLDHERGLPVRERTSGRKFLDALRLLRTSQPHRTIQAAAIRGHDRAARILASNGNKRENEGNQ